MLKDLGNYQYVLILFQYLNSTMCDELNSERVVIIHSCREQHA